MWGRAVITRAAATCKTGSSQTASRIIIPDVYMERDGEGKCDSSVSRVFSPANANLPSSSNGDSTLLNAINVLQAAGSKG